ncbi:hypothetical protein CGCTS75_v006426 [Colletotrichum tropicale]|nr:hypothetical protein CGCTS75_v006426 [Colletotrichum tropicale]
MKASIHIFAIISASVPIVAQTSSDVISDTTVLRTITSSPVSPQTGCPTATETLEICSTCMVLQCITISTLTHGCGCPTPVPTERSSMRWHSEWKRNTRHHHIDNWTGYYNDDNRSNR